MRSFKDYRPTSGDDGANNGANGNNGGNIPTDNDGGYGQTYAPKTTNTYAGDAAGNSAADLTKKIAAAYNGKSSGEMLSGILKEAERSKRAGTLSNTEIDNFYEQFSPMLNSSQRRQLKSVVERLKRI